jgi:hypothetical protein
MTKAQSDLKQKLRVLNYTREIGDVFKAGGYLGISREIYYHWKRAYEQRREKVLINSQPYPENLKRRTPPQIEGKILNIRRKYHLGQLRISWLSAIMGLKSHQAAYMGC